MRNRIGGSRQRQASIAIAGALLVLAIVARGQSQVPRIWDDAALEDWATPIAALGVRPAHYMSAEYYQVPADNLRTYPVYVPDKEPPGYWEWLQQQKPEPLVDVGAIRGERDWIRAGAQAFRDLDTPPARTNDPKMIALARDPRAFEGVKPQPDGSVLDVRWVVTSRGVELTVTECSSCHVHVLDEGRIMYAGPSGRFASDGGAPLVPPGIPVLQMFAGVLLQQFAGDNIRVALWRASTTPWSPDERVEKFRTEDVPNFAEIFTGTGSGVVFRLNGHPYYGAKIPDLHTVRYSRYIDATGTHRMRGPEDIARYAALVTGADPLEFGEHQMLKPEQRGVRYRYADEVLYAIGMYVMSLEPPANPNPPPPNVVVRGRRVFEAEGCHQCHAPPDSTTGGLTLALGFDAPRDHPYAEDILRRTVQTDPGLALKTRKGTGFYKIPSLRGLWYRPRLLHDGALASLEEMFDPARLRPDYEPKGWSPYGMKQRPIPGHPFGLQLEPDDRRALLAFLRSL
jgi:hypothetical protein